MQSQSLIAFIFVVLFAMTVVLAQANKEREQFADLLQKRKHLNGYWVGKRYALASDEEPFVDSGKTSITLIHSSTIYCR
jgi:Ni,Fe-hydrogenase I cytochrome b subunit